jgi:hypothetical protein
MKTPEKSRFDSRFSKGRLDNYFHYQANQDIKSSLSACIVFTNEENKVKGYCTLFNAGIQRDLLHEDIINKLPKSSSNLPVTLLG